MQLSKILVVDDEPDLESLVKQKFRKEIKESQYDFTFAGNGVQALKKINEDSNIELVLADINMPEMDGLTLLSKIKEMNNPLLHSVIVSAYGDIKNIRTAMNGGAFDFVVKPIDFTDLKITIDKAVGNLETLKKALQARDKLVILQNELEGARELQLSMLPSELPVVSNLDIAVYMQTATEVGGDYYDFSTKNDGSLNICLGDATGHGMKAGILVSMMKSLFVSNSVNKEIDDFFESSNSALKKANLKRMMVAFTMLNINDSKAKLINAGMPPLYHYKRSKSKLDELKNHKLPLGAMAVDNYDITEINLNQGDLIIMMTDGFPELRNSSDELLGYERVVTAIENTIDKEPKEIIEALKEEGSKWTNNKELEDDVSFVVFKIK